MNLIMIDPGHGGQDPGAVANGLKEKDLNLHIAASLHSLLQKSNVAAQLTRADDRLVSLKARCEMANNLKAGLFLSVHCNASENAEARGIELFHAAGSGCGEKLANALLQKLGELGRHLRGIQPADFYVLKHTVMPACLVECGFLTNPEEAAWLENHTGEIAQALAHGLINHIS